MKSVFLNILSNLKISHLLIYLAILNMLLNFHNYATIFITPQESKNSATLCIEIPTE